MRAQEFVVEARRGKISKRNQYATVGLNTFHDSQRANNDYTLNRVMMAAAMREEHWPALEQAAVAVDEEWKQGIALLKQFDAQALRA